MGVAGRDHGYPAEVSYQAFDLGAEVAAGVRWELAQESLWGEQWMTLRRLPEPDPGAPARDPLPWDILVL